MLIGPSFSRVAKESFCVLRALQSKASSAPSDYRAQVGTVAMGPTVEEPV